MIFGVVGYTKAYALRNSENFLSCVIVQAKSQILKGDTRIGYKVCQFYKNVVFFFFKPREFRTFGL